MTYLVMWKNWCHWNMSNKCKLCPLVWKVLWMPTPLLPPHHCFPLISLPPTPPPCLSAHPLASHHTLLLLTPPPLLPPPSPLPLANKPQPFTPPACLPFPTSCFSLQPLTCHLHPFPFTSISSYLHRFSLNPFSSHPTSFPLIPPLCLSFHPLASSHPPIFSSHLFASHPTPLSLILSLSLTLPACLSLPPHLPLT